jgi:HAE1 family hydrophobic/amphiphilic exporter-1
MEVMTEACLLCFRPITMTTMDTILATLPIALGFAAGAEARRPLGIAVAAALVLSQFLTLFLPPVFYVSMEKLSKRWDKLKASE